MAQSSFGRREFLGSTMAAPAVLAQRSPNDRVGVAVIGVGTRGTGLMRAPSSEKWRPS